MAMNKADILRSADLIKTAVEGKHGLEAIQAFLEAANICNARQDTMDFVRIAIAHEWSTGQPLPFPEARAIMDQRFDVWSGTLRYALRDSLQRTTLLATEDVDDQGIPPGRNIDPYRTWISYLSDPTKRLMLRKADEQEVNRLLALGRAEDMFPDQAGEDDGQGRRVPITIARDILDLFASNFSRLSTLEVMRKYLLYFGEGRRGDDENAVNAN